MSKLKEKVISEIKKIYDPEIPVRKELGKYSQQLLDKEELIVFNKIDLIEEDQIKEKLDKFKKEIKKDALVMSTFDKKTISNIKSKLINHVS